MMVERPAGTHLSQSSTPGGANALVRDDGNTLVTHAVLYPADEELEEARADGVRVGLVAGVAIGVVATVAVGAVVVKVLLHVKTRLGDLKAKLGRKPEDQEDEDTNETAAQEARPPVTRSGESGGPRPLAGPAGSRLRP
ncbi:hypothetical protein C5L38_34515 (plasmid) [Streptomyces sp. WAC00288]|nr:hypothetical protein C5L38_33695 [Streptomyces sp. WAC00288]AVI00179.1 hypothetical protein C5L38_34515 [Streptomyces sp. WAC00288]KYG51101.1 hypothetical protein AWI43_32120 [Streptomyces sp. WAC04657]